LIVSEQQTNIVTNSNAVSETIAFASSKIDSQGCVRMLMQYPKLNIISGLSNIKREG
jgi:hypothetical protein